MALWPIRGQIALYPSFFLCAFIPKKAVISFQNSATTVTAQTITIPAIKDNLLCLTEQTYLSGR